MVVHRAHGYPQFADSLERTRSADDHDVHVGFIRGVLDALVDLVVPAPCAGCGAFGARSLCPECASQLTAGAPVRPRGAHPELPACWSAATYDGPVRALILAYKERGERALAAPLGAALARVVLSGLDRAPPNWPLVLVPVPSTAAAVRARQGDHMLRLARHTAAALARRGWAVTVATPVRALPRVDSAHLGRWERADAAWTAFAPSRGKRSSRRSPWPPGDAVVVLLDDVLTTGATLAAMARQLAALGAPVAFAATVAATRLRGVDAGAPIAPTRSGGWG